MHITQGGATIDYPSLSCGGSLTLLSNSGTSAQFHEHITYGNCVDGGAIASTSSTVSLPGRGLGRT
jgi:hypothetical protein